MILTSLSFFFIVSACIRVVISYDKIDSHLVNNVDIAATTDKTSESALLDNNPVLRKRTLRAGPYSDRRQALQVKSTAVVQMT